MFTIVLGVILTLEKEKVEMSSTELRFEGRDLSNLSSSCDSQQGLRLLSAMVEWLEGFACASNHFQTIETLSLWK